MAKFLAVCLGSGSAAPKAIDEPQSKAGMAGWMKWAEAHERSIVDQGAPLGKTKLIDAGGVSDTRNALVAYTIVEADSHEAAAKMFVDHPHFTIFPGTGVEIMECLPTPAM